MKGKISLEDLVEQFLDQCRSGNVPDIQDFAGAHPEFASELLALLPLVMEMEDWSVEKKQGIMPPVHDFPDLEGDDYRLIRRLGSGGMGVVFEALQLSLNRKVAVKLLSPLLLQDAAQRIQFEHEAHVIARLHHPNIVRIFSAACRPGCCYYAMELIEGKSLDGCEFSNPYEIARIGLQAARAIAYAHRCGILHRDIKPANLLLDEAGEVHVSDFGLAFLLQGRNEVIEKEGAQSGTLRYMSPERLVHGVNTFSSDQYAFGVTLYELVAKSPPFPGLAPEELMERICREPVPPLKCSEPDLAAIINKCVSFRPESRYRSMDELSEDLLHFLNHEPVGASFPSPARRLQLWMKRKPAVAVLSLAAALCAAAFVVALGAGYLQTASALKLAENNAAVADAALSQVFTRIAEQPPSQKNTQLLSALLPYYRMIARGKNLPESKVCEANAVIGECALRTGSYALAEEAFRNMMKFRKDAFPVNQLATALKKQGKDKEATELFRQVADRFAMSERAEDRFETIRALLALSGSPESVERSRAFGMLETLLEDDPDHPEYRFQYAQLLAGNPRLFRERRIPGIEPNAAVLLLQLADAHPERPEYGLALVELMLKKLRYARNFREHNQRELADTVNLSERLLGRWPNDPQVISGMVRLHARYIGALRREGKNAWARRESDRLQGILEVLFYNPEISDAVKESLIRLQLQRLKLLRHDGRSYEGEDLRKKISRELGFYHGPMLRVFREELDKAGPDDESSVGKSEDSIIFERTKQGL